ncbi:MAG TPA: AMP-binding protein [Verrucomicrobiae bacterium]|nr:AMP-binding protein [Verrucomicrobiae bacterium]
MLEPLIRSNLPRLQSLYDRAPSPARDLLASARGWFLTRLRYGRGTSELLEELRRHESWRPTDISSYQLSALSAVADFARRTVPFYASYSQAPLRSLDDLRALPVLSRETLRRNTGLFLSSGVPPHRRIRAGTTGTTGANLSVAYTEDLARANWALLLRQWAWAGVSPREPRVTFFGARVVPPSRTTPPFWTRNLAERQTLASIFHLSEKTAPHYLDFLESHAGEVLEGFPSVLAILADFALSRGLPVPMRVVFTSGEPLYPEAREKISRAFAAPVFDSYGMTEYCGLIQQCAAGGMHLIPEFGYLEILDDRDEPVSPGEEGHFVWTGFLNRAMPLLRYRIGDRGRWQTGSPCACGRAFPLVVPTITRESDILRCPDGRLFSPRALNQLLKQTASLRFCQFVHAAPGRVVIHIVPGGRRAPEEAALLRERLQSLLGPQIRVSFELTADPLSRPGGKIPLILNQVRP